MRRLIAASALVIFAGCLAPEQSTAAGSADQSGIASIYSTSSGSRTASGKRLNNAALTAAHRSLPFGTTVRVTNRKNGRSVVVTINDRGPFVRGRVIDVTPAAARALGFSGLTRVSLQVAPDSEAVSELGEGDPIATLLAALDQADQREARLVERPH
jgi:rare lipoprotein A